MESSSLGEGGEPSSPEPIGSGVTNAVIAQLKERNESLSHALQDERRGRHEAEARLHDELDGLRQLCQIYQIREVGLLCEQEVDKREVLCANESALRRAVQAEFYSMRRLFLQRGAAESELSHAARDNAALHQEISNLTLKIGEQSQTQSQLEQERRDAHQRMLTAQRDLREVRHSQELIAWEQDESDARRTLVMSEALALSSVVGEAMRLREAESEKVLRRAFEAGEMRLLAERVLAEQQDRDSAVLALRHEAETTLNQLQGVLAKKEAALRQISDLLAQNAALTQDLSAAQSKVDHLQEEKIQLNQKVASLRHRVRAKDRASESDRGASEERSRSECREGSVAGVVVPRGGGGVVAAVQGDVDAIMTQREARNLATEITNLRKAGRALRRDLEDSGADRDRFRGMLEKKTLEADTLKDRVKQLQKRLSRAEKAAKAGEAPPSGAQPNQPRILSNPHNRARSPVVQITPPRSSTPIYHHTFEPTEMRTAIRAQHGRSSSGGSVSATRRRAYSLSPTRGRGRIASPTPTVDENARIMSLRGLLGSKEDYILVLRGEVERTTARLEAATSKAQSLETDLARKESEMRLAEAAGAAERATPDRRTLFAESTVAELREKVAVLEGEVEAKNREMESYWLRLDNREEEVEQLSGRLREAEAVAASSHAPIPQLPPKPEPATRPADGSGPASVEALRVEVSELREAARIMTKKHQYYENRVNDLKDEREKSILHSEDLERQLREAHQCAANAALEINSIVVERGIEKDRYSTIVSQLESRIQQSASLSHSGVGGADVSRMEPLPEGAAAGGGGGGGVGGRCSPCGCEEMRAELAQRDESIRALQAEVEHLQSQLRSARYRAGQNKAAAATAQERAHSAEAAYQHLANDVKHQQQQQQHSHHQQEPLARSPRASPPRTAASLTDRGTSPRTPSRSRSCSPAWGGGGGGGVQGGGGGGIRVIGRGDDAQRGGEAQAAESRRLREEVEREMADREARCERILKDAKTRMQRERAAEAKYHNEIADLQCEIDDLKEGLKQARTGHMREVAELRLNAERLSARADSRQAKVRELQLQLRESHHQHQEPESIVLEDTRRTSTGRTRRR